MTDKPLINAMPGLIALKTRAAGEIGILALLGIGVVHSGGTPFEDQHLSRFYADLATDRDVAGTVKACWAYAAAAHPWMAPSLAPVLEHLRPTEHLEMGLREGAEYLATVSISGSESMAHADLLGRVLTEHRALVHKRQQPGHSFTLAEGMLEMAFHGKVLEDGESFADLWAASGMRAVAVAVTMRDLDRDPTTCRWVLMESDPMLRAVLAMNCLAWEMGEHVEIHDGTAYKQSLIAAYMAGDVPDFNGIMQGNLASVPDEVFAGVHDEPVTRRKKGKRRA